MKYNGKWKMLYLWEIIVKHNVGTNYQRISSQNITSDLSIVVIF